ESGDDAFSAGEETRGFEGGGIGDGSVFGAALIGEPGVFWANGGIVEASGDRVRGGDLAVSRLQDGGVGGPEKAGARSGEALMRGEPGGVFAEFVASAAGFYTDQLDRFILEKFVKQSDGVGAAANAGKEVRGKAIFGG